MSEQGFPSFVRSFVRSSRIGLGIILGVAVAAALWTVVPSPERPLRIATAALEIPALEVGAVPRLDRDEAPWQPPELDPLPLRPRQRESILSKTRAKAADTPRNATARTVAPSLREAADPRLATPRSGGRDAVVRTAHVLTLDHLHAGPTQTTAKQIAPLVSRKASPSADTGEKTPAPREQPAAQIDAQQAQAPQAEEPAEAPSHAQRPRPVKQPAQEIFDLGPIIVAQLGGDPGPQHLLPQLSHLPELLGFEEEVEPLLLDYGNGEPSPPSILELPSLGHPFGPPVPPGRPTTHVPPKLYEDFAREQGKRLGMENGPLGRNHVIPEPGTAALVAAGLVLIGLRRR